MILSLFRKCINAILLLWVISIIAFWLSKLTPGDEVMEYLTIDDPRYNINSNPSELRKAYNLIAHRRGLDLPLFYWSVSPSYYPQDVNRILPLEDRKSLKSWIDASKTGSLSLRLHQELKSGLNTYCLNNNSIHSNDFLCQQFNTALKTDDLKLLRKNMNDLKNTFPKDSIFNTVNINQLSTIVSLCDTLLLKKSPVMASTLFPLFEWNGTHNQYHQWMSGLLSQRPLTSLVDGLNAWGKIYDALKWTLLLNGFAFLLAIFLGVAIGIWSGIHDGHPAERILNWILFALFALPSFWLGTLFIYALTSGEWLSLFPSGGLGPYHSARNMLEKWSILFSHLILPVTCLALGALAYVSRQMKQSILHQSEQPYVKALRAKEYLNEPS